MNNLELAESWLGRAWHKQNEARENIQKCKYAESVSASQESIELAIKSLLLACDVNFPKSHRVKEPPFVKLMPKIPATIRTCYNFPRVLLLAKFWSTFYLVTKYGFEELKVGADKLFRKEEANLAAQHAQEVDSACHDAYQGIKWHR
jgi:HEPN domain-containing protein